ncbi:MAG: nitrilase-related carbon-nitrogen hydrolase [Nitrososphaerales archaeon]|jgi:predicted amidohydrolase
MASEIILGAFVQTRPKFGQNKENIEEAIRLASKVRADIYVFPELCNTGYAFRSKSECHLLAESLRNGISVEQFQSFTEKRKCTIVAGLAEKDGEKTYNSSVVIERGRILGTYRKMHLFFREKLWFSKSSSGFKTFSLETLGCKIGVLICFDWFFPEASRKLTMEGAEVICHPSDLVLPGKAQIGMMVSAFENRVFAITANRVGSENRGPKDKFQFTGKSQIISPDMERLVRAGTTEVTAKVAKIDLKLARSKYVTTMNDLFKDRRADYY